MVLGSSIDRHHWVPRRDGGREASAIHTVCHRKIHAVLSEREIAAAYTTPEALRTHPEIAAFLCWVARKTPAFVDWHRSPRRRR